MAINGRDGGSSDRSTTELEVVERCLSELQAAIRSEGPSIPAHAYAKISDSFRDLEHAVAALRRSNS